MSNAMLRFPYKTLKKILNPLFLVLICITYSLKSRIFILEYTQMTYPLLCYEKVTSEPENIIQTYEIKWNLIKTKSQIF